MSRRCSVCDRAWVTHSHTQRAVCTKLGWDSVEDEYVDDQDEIQDKFAALERIYREDRCECGALVDDGQPCHSCLTLERDGIEGWGR